MLVFIILTSKISKHDEKKNLSVLSSEKHELIKAFLQAVQSLASFPGTINFNITVASFSSPASDNRPKNDFSSVRPESNSDIPLFKYIHIAVTDEKEREQIHKMIHNIVHLPKMQQVCEELYKLMKDRKVLCTINPDSMLAELRRMGLPNGDINGFSDKNFAHYYRAPKIA